MEDPLYIEKQWFEQIALGNEETFVQLFHYYNARLFPYIRKITKSDTIAEDIVQEVFLRLWVNRDKLAEMERPGAWLFLVASNLSMTYLRNIVNQSVKHKGAYLSAEQELPGNVFQKLERKELAEAVEAAVQLLPPRRQQIFRLSRQDGLTHKEISAQLGVSPSTVKDHLVIALKTIREHIQKQTDYHLGFILLLIGLLKK